MSIINQQLYTDIINSSQLDILALQEIWHENSDSLALRRAVPDGYYVIDEARVNKNSASQQHSKFHGGVAIIYRSEYNAKKLVSLPHFSTFEYVGCRFNASHKGDVVILSVYRPGSKSITSQFFTELTTLFE